MTLKSTMAISLIVCGFLCAVKIAKVDAAAIDQTSNNGSLSSIETNDVLRLDESFENNIEASILEEVRNNWETLKGNLASNEEYSNRTAVLINLRKIQRDNFNAQNLKCLWAGDWGAYEKKRRLYALKLGSAGNLLISLQSGGNNAGVIVNDGATLGSRMHLLSGTIAVDSSALNYAIIYVDAVMHAFLTTF